jgi:hypothetical protein
MRISPRVDTSSCRSQERLGQALHLAAHSLCVKPVITFPAIDVAFEFNLGACSTELLLNEQPGVLFVNGLTASCLESSLATVYSTASYSYALLQ